MYWLAEVVIWWHGGLQSFLGSCWFKEIKSTADENESLMLTSGLKKSKEEKELLRKICSEEKICSICMMGHCKTKRGVVFCLSCVLLTSDPGHQKLFCTYISTKICLLILIERSSPIFQPLCHGLPSFLKITLTNDHRLYTLNNWNLFLRVLRLDVPNQCVNSLVSAGSSVPGLQTVVFSLGLYVIFSSVSTQYCVSSSSYTDIISFGLDLQSSDFI